MTARDQSGYTLVEMLIVVGLLTLIAAVAVPSINQEEDALQLVMHEVTRAIEFARSEAIRTGDPHGISASFFTQNLRVYRLDVASGSVDPIYDVINPQTRTLYAITFNNDARPPSIRAALFFFSGSFFPRTDLSFDGKTGAPKYVRTSDARLLSSASIEFEHDGRRQRVIVSPVTGRVTLQ